jgi:succinate dehydrogenase flavin-adding protein (antitoxin of CptAB toxin-antitoxin module)
LTEPYEPPSRQRLRWLARRGMLELDSWLNRFLDHYFDSDATGGNLGPKAALTIAQQRQFVYLLNQDDMTLYDWLTGHVDPPDDMRFLVDEIRAMQTYRRSSLT